MPQLGPAFPHAASSFRSSIPVFRLRHWPLCVVLASALVMSLPGGAQAQQASMPGMPPPVLMRVPEGNQPVQVVASLAEVELAGTRARTRLELVFLNPNRRVLEGDLQFPLGAAQQVVGFALEAPDGRGMLPAVPVEKARGRQVFEDVTRRRVDPALLEQTVGENFKLRVYPLAPGKPRKVVLELDETLSPGADGRVRYQPPAFLRSLPNAHLRIRGVGLARRQVQAGAAWQPAMLADEAGSLVAYHEQAAPAPKADLSLSWKASPALILSTHAGARYFSTDVALDLPQRPRPVPQQMLIVWDASGSGQGRDHARELALLDAYFHSLPPAHGLAVALRVVRDQAEALRHYTIKAGQWQALRQDLERMVYDGASRGEAWFAPTGLPKAPDLALLFSDGLSNWGREDAAAPPDLPLYAVVATPQAASLALRSLSEAQGGQLLDLARQEPREAARALGVERARVVALEGQGVKDLVLGPVDGRQATLAGQLDAPEGQVSLSLGWPGKVVKRQTLKLDGRRPDSAGPWAAQTWARLRIDTLEAAPRLHRAEILRLGERFGVVSSLSSLLVLESLEDHLQYRVLPPEGPWRAAYLARIGPEGGDQAQVSAHLDQLARRFADKQKWWDTDFPKGPQPPPPEAEPPRTSAGARDARRETAAVAPMVRPLAMMAPAPMPVAVAAAAAPAAAPSAPGQAAASIQLQAWQPDASYARRLQDARPEERYAIYLDERGSHTNSTAFYLDVAEIFFQQGEPALALRILSNLAEMDLENRALLRILAYRLIQAGQAADALPLLERVRTLAPDEPQSWRDLGLAQQEAGRYQAALDNLWETVRRPWSGRFADIDLIALAELNALVAQHPELDAGRVDQRLRRNLPLDLRAVLSWDSDNTDIDLWVTDPNGEKVYFAHPQSYQGGRISRDFTGGYGPEEFSLKLAKPGRYEVRAQFYGHRQQIISPYTSLMLRLSTGFGTPAQKDERVILRLSGQGEAVLVGSFEVLPPKSE